MTRETYHSWRAILPLTLAFIGAHSWAAEAPPRPASQQEYWSQFDRKDWDAAVSEAERLVAAARGAEPMQALRLADALSLLGNAQLGKKNYVAAESAFSEALKLVEQHSIPTSANLLTPLSGLGYAVAAAGRHADAVPLLERALLISHRTQGLFNVGQQGILRQLAFSLTQVRRTDEAEKHMGYLLRIGERSYGANDARLIPILNTVADWHCDTAHFGTARQLYAMALRIANEKLGSNALATIEPLRGLARTYTDELYYSTLGLVFQRERNSMAGDPREEPKPINPRHLSTDGQEALERALKTLESAPDHPPEMLAATLVQLGDWHQIKQETDKALRYYQRAWHVEGTTPEASGKAQLSFPLRLYYPMPQSAARTLHLSPEESEERFVQLEFTVTSEGAVKDARVVEENASARRASDALQAIRGARFRPKFVEGVPVETTAVTYREVFRIKKKNGAKEEEEKGSKS